MPQPTEIKLPNNCASTDALKDINNSYLNQHVTLAQKTDQPNQAKKIEPWHKSNEQFIKNFKKFTKLSEKLVFEIDKNKLNNQPKDLALATLINSMNPSKNQRLETIETALTDFKKEFKDDCSDTLLSIAAAIVGVVTGIVSGIMGAIVGFIYGLCQWQYAGLAAIPMFFACGYVLTRQGFTNGQEAVLGTERTLVKTVQALNPNLFWKERTPEILTKPYHTLTQQQEKQQFFTELLLLTDTQALNLFTKHESLSLTTLKDNAQAKIDELSVPEDKKYYQSIINKIEKIEEHFKAPIEDDLHATYIANFKAF